MLSQTAGFSSSSWLNNIPLYICHIFSIHSSVDGHLGCFNILTIVSNAAVNLECSYLFEVQFLFLLDAYPEVGWLDHVVVLF